LPRFSEQFIQQVAQATDIVELVGQYVALKKRGKEFVGLCPFHDDKHPSLNVSAAKQIFKCFVCGAGGGVFQWMMMYDKASFPEAVETLAERANIPIPQERPLPAGEQDLGKAELVKAATFAARFYRDQLHLPPGAAALEYARKRGLTEESIKRFGLGYAPDFWDALLLAARREGFSEAQLVAAGLVARREDGGCYDRFRNRLIFPILDVSGKVIAFGGRALDPNDRAKYINSPESPLFDKSASLYALNWSREGISSTGQAVVVEGYMDAVIPLQAGINNVVATLGTALTERHVRVLSRYAREVVLVFDADAAGQAATDRALEMFLVQQVQVRVVTIPSGKDPCDYTLAEGGEAMRRLIEQAPDALQYAWTSRQEALRAAGGNLADRRRVVEDFLRLVVSSSAYGVIDEIRRGQLAQHIAHLLNVSSADLQQQMRRLAREARVPAGGGQVPRGSVGKPDEEAAQAAGATMTERHVLEVLLNRPDLVDTAGRQIDPGQFVDGELRLIAQRLWQGGPSGRPTMEELLAMEEVSHLAGLITELATAGERRGNYERTLAGAVEQMVYRRGRQEMQDLKKSGLDDETLRGLTPRLRKADVRKFPGLR
jgi:DNA primase